MKHKPSPLGVGFTWQADLQTALGAGYDLLDFLEVSPDVLCRETISDGKRQLSYQPELLQNALDSIQDIPVVVHGLGLSIGSTTGWSEEYLEILDEFAQRQHFHWHSEHLAFMLTELPDGSPLHTGIPLPLPFTDEAVDLVAPRAAALGERYGVPFLLENLAYYLPGLPTENGRDEIAFLNAITERSGCGLLLDLYNFHCNAVNFGFDPIEALSRLHMESVIEIHLAGGAQHDGFLTDIHTREVPEPVWQLLEFVAPRAKNLSGIVYEVMEPAIPLLGSERLTQQIARVRHIWDRYCAPHHRSTYAIG